MEKILGDEDAPLFMIELMAIWQTRRLWKNFNGRRIRIIKSESQKWSQTRGVLDCEAHMEF